MEGQIIWKIKNENEFSEVRKIVVSSDNLKNNHEVCSLLESGWIVLKLEIQNKKQNVDYSYLLGNPIRWN